MFGYQNSDKRPLDGKWLNGPRELPSTGVKLKDFYFVYLDKTTGDDWNVNAAINPQYTWCYTDTAMTWTYHQVAKGHERARNPLYDSILSGRGVVHVHGLSVTRDYH